MTLVKPVRVGFTTLLTGAIGSYVANEPSPVLCAAADRSRLPRLRRVATWSRYLPHRPALRGTLAPDAEEGERNTLTSQTLSRRLAQDRGRASAAQSAPAHRAHVDR